MSARHVQRRLGLWCEFSMRMYVDPVQLDVVGALGRLPDLPIAPTAPTPAGADEGVALSARAIVVSS